MWDGPDPPFLPQDSPGTGSCADHGRLSRTVGTSGPFRSPIEGGSMADKSPRSSMSKKSGKSLKEKRAEKKTRTNIKADAEIVANVRKR